MGMEQLRDRAWLRRLAFTLAVLAPAVLAILASGLLFPQNLLETAAKPEAMASETPSVLSDLISQMIAMSIGVMVAGWFLYRKPVILASALRHAVLPVMITGAAFVSLFAGLRGLYALAFVISTQPFDMIRVSPYIEAQSVFLVLEVMLLSLHALNFAIYRDRRKGLD